MEDNGAAVVKKSLLNGYIMNGDCYPAVTCTRDCSDQLAAGGSKNCRYIADIFTKLVKLYDPRNGHGSILF